MKKIFSILLSTVFIITAFTGCQTSPPVEEGIVEKEYFFETADENGTSNFPETITINGQTYEISGFSDIQYETTDSEEMVEMIVDVAVEDESEIKPVQEFEYNGQKYVFDLAETQLTAGTINRTVTTTADYENYTSEPQDVPEKTMVDVTIGNETKEFEGSLVKLEQISDYQWMNNLYLTGVWTGDPAAQQYSLDGAGITVPYDAAKPTWPGFGDAIRNSLGLSSNYYKITDGYWTDAREIQNGQFIRHAAYTGERYVANYRATYEVTYSTEGFSGNAIYRANAEKLNADQDDRVTIYTIKAVVKYKLVETAE